MYVNYLLSFTRQWRKMIIFALMVENAISCEFMKLLKCTKYTVFGTI